MDTLRRVEHRRKVRRGVALVQRLPPCGCDGPRVWSNALHGGDSKRLGCCTTELEWDSSEHTSSLQAGARPHSQYLLYRSYLHTWEVTPFRADSQLAWARPLGAVSALEQGPTASPQLGIRARTRTRTRIQARAPSDDLWQSNTTAEPPLDEALSPLCARAATAGQGALASLPQALCFGHGPLNPAHAIPAGGWSFEHPDSTALPCPRRASNAHCK
jgi:hypothetical protein